MFVCVFVCVCVCMCEGDSISKMHTVLSLSVPAVARTLPGRSPCKNLQTHISDN